MIETKINKFIAVDETLTATSLAESIQRIQTILEYETESRICLLIPTDQTRLYSGKSEPVFGEKILRKFPSIIYDLDEAGKCAEAEQTELPRTSRAILKPIVQENTVCL